MKQPITFGFAVLFWSAAAQAHDGSHDASILDRIIGFFERPQNVALSVAIFAIFLFLFNRYVGWNWLNRR